MISIDKVSVEFGGFKLFHEVSFLVNPKDRIGLVGKNGAGKSTLLKMIVGQQAPASGTITMPQDIKIGYLPQHMATADGKTVIEECRTAFSELNQLNHKINELNHKISSRTDYDSPAYSKLLEKLAFYSDRLHYFDADSQEESMEKTLVGLGFEPSDMNRQTREFSGGWRMRIELAKILLRKPNAILLDEPTNHLDIEAILWLEEFLKNYNGAVVLISHDRRFLDNITERTVELSMGRAFDYNAPYSRYVELRKERRETQLAAYRNQQRMIEKTEDFIERFRYKATKAVQVQQRIRQLDKLDIIEVDEEDTTKINIRFPEAPRSGAIVVEAENLSKQYGDNLVLDDITISIERGEKVAFVGRNGEGKSTLAKIVMGQLEYSGNLKIGHQVNVGYFAQNQDELLNENLTVFQTIDNIAVGDIRTKIRDILGAFLFSGEDIDKKVKVLSGGERSRLSIATLLLKPYNLLVLDEPTNHLDMRSKEILKKALLDFKGTLIVVSHDREFLSGLTNKVFEFRHRKIKEYLGDITDFLAKRNIASMKELEFKQKKKDVNLPKIPQDNKAEYQKKKEQEKEIRKLDTRIRNAEESIHDTEKKIEALSLLLSNPEELKKSGSPESTYKEYDELKKTLESKMEEWEKLCAERDEFAKS